MSLQTRAASECDVMRARMASMRMIIGELEDLMPAAHRLLASLRVEMCCLAADLNALDTTCAAQRALGERAPLLPQAPVESTPLFASAAAPAEVPPFKALATAPEPEPGPARMPVGRALTAHDVAAHKALLRTLHRAGDRTLDKEDDA